MLLGAFTHLHELKQLPFIPGDGYEQNWPLEKVTQLLQP